VFRRRPHDAQLVAKPPDPNRQTRDLGAIPREVEARMRVARQRDDSRELDQDLLSA
jgi:hypothetical protein